MKKKPTLSHLKPTRVVVGIGASAGSLEPLKKFLETIGNPKDISLVLVQHIDARGEKLIAEVLKNITSLKIVEIKNGLRVKTQTLFYAPPSSRVKLKNGVFEVEKMKAHTHDVLAIDTFLKSLAQEERQAAVGMILSGDGVDGASGIKDLNEYGGLTLVQTPEKSDYPSMPAHACATGIIDFVGEPEALAEKVLSHATYVTETLGTQKTRSLHEHIISALVEICEALYKVTRHDFKHYKTSTLVRRIQRRMQVLQIQEVDEYVLKLQSDVKEADSLFKELLINVTSFFRDPQAFDHLKKDVLAKSLNGRKSDQKYRIWVAGCSTGEEVYTLAILVREILAKISNPPEVQIIATDIDEAALSIARKGSYPLSISENVTPARLKKHFNKKSGRYIVTKELRELVLFSSHNLINDPPFSQLDLISCRNVLIYLGAHLQKKLIPVFHYALRPGGYLFLGTSESLTSHKELFRTLSAKYRIGQRKATSIRSPGFHTVLSSAYLSQTPDVSRSHEADIHQVSQRIVLDEFSPKYAVVNDDCQIVSVSSGLAQYLDPSEGSFQNNLMKLVKTSLRVGLRSAFNEARKHKRKITHQSSTLKLEHELARIGITVQPMPQLGDQDALYMVVFHYFGSLQNKDAGKERDPNSANMALVEQLETELATLREDLDRSVQDLEASNEELKSSNEELLSMNEELQSANEELETSKEDVQIANEALQRNNTDLENLLTSTEIATLFLDEFLCIKSFTPQLESIYNITKVDIGRPISHLTNQAKKMPPFPKPQDIALGQILMEQDIEMADGRWILRRISPYKTNEGLFSGIVVTFIDMTHVRTAEERYRQLANSMPQIVWTAESNGHIDYFNKRWYEFSGYQKGDQILREWEEIIHPGDRTRAIHLWKESVQTGKPFEIEYRFKDFKRDQYRWFLGRAIPAYDFDGEITKWFGSCIDIHEQKMATERLKDNEQRLDMMFKTSPSFMALLNGPDFVFEKANDRYLQLVGHREILGKTVQEALPEVVEQGFIDLLKKVYSTGEPHIGTEVPVFLQQLPNTSPDMRYLDFVYLPYQTHGLVERIFVHGTDVTEKVHAREIIENSKIAIENERQNFRNLFKQTPEMVCILLGPHHVFEFVNDAHIKVLGFDATGMAVREAQPESIEVHGILDNVFRTGKTAELHEIPVTLTDRLRYFNLTYSARRDSNGAINGVMILGTEVTNEVLSRRENEEARSHLELALESGQMGTWRNDLIKRMTTFSQKAAEIFGFGIAGSYPFEEVSDFVHPEDLKKAVGVFENAIQSKKPYHHEYRIIRPDGQIRWVLSRGNAVFDTSGNPFLVSGVITDITDRKLAVNAISESRERYKILFDLSPLPKWIFDTESLMFSDVNGTATRHYGYSREEFLKMKITDLLPKEDIPIFQEALNREQDLSEGHHPYNYRHIKKDGSVIYVKVSALQLSIDGRVCRFDAMMDITERLNAEYEQAELLSNLQVAKSDAERAQNEAERANESKTRFLANMSHEIRTPLAAILGFSELLQGRTREGDTDAALQLERISRNAAQLGRLIDELLDLSKIEAEKFEIERAPFGLEAALDDALASVSIRAKAKGLILDWKIKPDVPQMIYTDPTRFRQILINVIGNAVKFTESGSIDVEIDQELSHNHRFLKVRVKDTGIGMSPDQQKKIFEPFVQADTSVTRKYGGTGLGLILSKRLACLMGGDLVLEKSALGEGSVFALTIEVGNIHQPTFVREKITESTLLPAPAKALEGRRILIVDDSPDNQMIIQLFLRAVGAEIEIANNGLEAVEKMKLQSYDVVLMDIQMPVMDGYQALTVAKKNGYQRPIVALTAHALKEEKDRCLAAGFTEYLSKPIDRNLLIKRICELLA